MLLVKTNNPDLVLMQTIDEDDTLQNVLHIFPLIITKLAVNDSKLLCHFPTQPSTTSGIFETKSGPSLSSSFNESTRVDSLDVFRSYIKFLLALSSSS